MSDIQEPDGQEEVRAEKNLKNEETIDGEDTVRKYTKDMPNKKKKCPRCRATMKKAGKIRAGSRGGLRDVYYCPKCGYKSL